MYYYYILFNSGILKSYICHVTNIRSIGTTGTYFQPNLIKKKKGKKNIYLYFFKLFL